VEEANSMNATALQPFLTTALPIMVTILLAVWMNGKGFDGVHKRLDDMRSDFDRRFDAIEKRFDSPPCGAVRHAGASQGTGERREVLI
jgi:hypothetical protein